MAILYQAQTGRPWRRAVVVTAALSLGGALVWLARPQGPDAAPAPRVIARAPATLTAPPSDVPIDAGCDARCTVSKVIVPATAACVVAVEELAGFGVRWLDDAATAKFDRFVWLQPARGTVTLAGGHAEFRNAGGAYLPIAYECDFDPATLAVIEARARPGTSTPGAAGTQAGR